MNRYLTIFSNGRANDVSRKFHLEFRNSPFFVPRNIAVKAVLPIEFLVKAVSGNFDPLIKLILYSLTALLDIPNAFSSP